MNNPVIQLPVRNFKQSFRPKVGLTKKELITEFFNTIHSDYFKNDRFNTKVLNSIRLQLLEYFNYLRIDTQDILIDFEKKILTVTIGTPWEGTQTFELDANPTFDELVWVQCEDAIDYMNKFIDNYKTD